jgi:hypothetical protein
MKRSLFLLLFLAVVPMFADNITNIYYTYDYYEPGYYDEYWYNDYWYDGYWVYMPYGYYCVRFVWWYPWWWDWYWARCHWCHHFHMDFFYAGFYVVWYDHGTWWYRPRYGNYVRYRLPYTYNVLRVKARTSGIYLPEKPPREINLPYRENQVMNLARQNDPGLFTRVEREQRSGNLERMRTNYVKQVNREIATKNREHGFNNMNIDINELSKREKPIARTNEMKSSNTRTSSGTQGSAQSESRDARTNVSREQTRVQTPSRIQKESKSQRPSERSAGGQTDRQRVEPTSKQEERPRSPSVEKSREGREVETRTPDRKEVKKEKPGTDSRQRTPQSQKPQDQRPIVSRNPRDERFYSTENVR